MYRLLLLLILWSGLLIPSAALPKAESNSAKQAQATDWVSSSLLQFDAVESQGDSSADDSQAAPDPTVLQTTRTSSLPAGLPAYARTQRHGAALIRGPPLLS